MPDEVSIDINSTKGQPAKFDPSPQTAMVGDLIFWRNNDEVNTHQPKPQNGKDNDWVTTPISVKLGDEAGTSNTYSPDSATSPNGQTYVCARHPNETGILIVRSNININSLPGAEVKPGVPQAAFNPNGKGVPQPSTVNVGAAFIWTNNDVKAHWPAPSVAEKTAWIQEQIQPGQTSKTISIGKATDDKGIAYVCALHTEETGTLVVNQPEE